MTRFIHQNPYIRKEIILIICIVTVFTILSYSLFARGGYRDLQKSRLELHERQIRVDALKIDVDRREKNIKAIDDDALKSGNPEALLLMEIKAREQGYARAGEYVQRVPD